MACIFSDGLVSPAGVDVSAPRQLRAVASEGGGGYCTARHQLCPGSLGDPINCLISFLNQMTYAVVRHEISKTHLEQAFSVLHSPGQGRASPSNGRPEHVFAGHV
jgi:hypothetical protein